MDTIRAAGLLSELIADFCNNINNGHVSAVLSQGSGWNGCTAVAYVSGEYICRGI